MVGNLDLDIKKETARDETPAIGKDRPPQTRTAAFRGLLWAEWFAHSKLLLFFLLGWIIVVWALPLFAPTGWILLFGAVFAFIAGPAYGAGDALEGCEEFSFALPATRGERYLARLTVGGGAFLGLSLINLLALGMDLPQVLARFYVQTGLIQSTPNLKPGLLYGLVLALPWAVFGFSFAIASLAHSRMLILTAWLWSALAVLLLLRLGLWYEDVVWESFTGFFSFPFLTLAGVAALWVGFRLYRQKEIGPPSTPITLPGRWWLWMLFFLLGIGAALVLLSSLAQYYPSLLALDSLAEPASDLARSL